MKSMLDLAERNLKRWQCEKTLKRLEMSAASAAYMTANDAGLAHRQDPGTAVMEECRRMDDATYARFVHDVIDYTAGFIFPTHLFAILTTIDALSPEQLEGCEYTLMQIDGLDAAIDFVVDIRPGADMDEQMLVGLSGMRQLVDRLLEPFDARPDITEVASRL